ncbi:hypothetical protein [Streptomyces sp. NPDC013181]|uniref:hypothetical protein n=1 Tax=Streptomyces sp. NPDC013181 TaxID=3364864 RepID=UPI0036B8E424
MHIDNPLVTLYREGLRVKARLNWSEPKPVASPDPRLEHGLSPITAPLRRRWVECTAEFGLSDYYVHAGLPDGSELIISPPQEPSTEHPPGRPDSWTVLHRDADSREEVIYDSAPDGAHARNGASIPKLLAFLNERLDLTGAPPSPEQEQLSKQRAAHTFLQQAGFLPGEVHDGEQHYRLPSTLDPAQEQRAVTWALDRLDEVDVPTSYDDSLLRSPETAWTDEPSLGDRLGELAGTVEAATHTRQVLASLREVTDPADGVLRHVVEILNATAATWENLGRPAAHAIRLRDTAEHLQLQMIKLLGLGSDMADSAAERPSTPQASAARTASTPRTRAARAPSPATAQHHPIAATPASPNSRTPPPATPDGTTRHR